MDDEAAAHARAEAGRAPALSLPALLREIVGELPGLVSDRVQLLSLELRRAGLALAQIVALVVAIGVLAVTAWIALWVGAAAALMAWGLGLGWTVTIVIGLNLAAAGLAAQRVRRLASLLGLPATVRRLTLPAAPPSSVEPPASAA
jgi:Putative Actinobacterial Holin-X, holin superfamily III